jgi:hypothetical protein
VLLIDAKARIWGRWLRLKFSFLMDITIHVGMTPLVYLLRYHI